MVTLKGGYTNESFGTAHSRGSGIYNFSSTDGPGIASFVFVGTGVQFLSCVGPQYGLVRVFLDGLLVQDIDASIVPAFVHPDPSSGFCNQLLFSTAALSDGQHNLTIENLQLQGLNSYPGSPGVAIISFAYVKGSDQCSGFSSLRAETALRSSYHNWVTHKTQGISGPVTGTVSFNASLLTAPVIRVPSILPLAVAPALNTSLAPSVLSPSPFSKEDASLGPYYVVQSLLVG